MEINRPKSRQKSLKEAAERPGSRQESLEIVLKAGRKAETRQKSLKKA